VQYTSVVPDPTITLLRDLIAIDSVNPLLSSGAAGERQIGEFVAAQLGSAGIDVEIQAVNSDRSNVIGVIDGQQAGRTLMLCGHMDTVGVAGMASPFDPVHKDGRIYGRGSQDMKGGLAAMISAVLHVARSGAMVKGRIILAAVIDEEYASSGADALVTQWKADAAVVGEPTDMKIAVGHKGFEWVEITTEGIAAHGSRPADGRDAILRMGRVLDRLERLDRSLQSREAHPIHGTASLHASLINGGRELSTYPDRCTLKMERRTIEGEPAYCGLTEAEQILSQLRSEDPEFSASSTSLFSRPPYLTPAGTDNEVARIISKGLLHRGLQPVSGGMSFWTDAAILGASGIPSIIFGPSGAGLHSTTEYVFADDVLTCRDILIDLVKDFCS
jgi:acetylornithine deacetylase